ncbi:hypothetical protein K438DRAFT_1979913 [Mycena galopus ATCC 62051]|nr:hypothetical protein K438DRAFT_1979913 [Mycena galopus ATCC 62051]
MSTSSSYANMHATVLLDRPRKFPNWPKTTFLDVYVFIGPNEDDTLLGCIRHFADTPVTFESGIYECIIMVAQNHKDVECCIPTVTDGDSQPVNHADYFFVGDLKHYFPVEAVDPHRAYMHISGAVIKSDTATASFHLDVQQYTGAYADLANKAKEVAAQTKSSVAVTPPSIFPVLGVIPSFSRFKSGKPVPYVNRLVMFGGFLTGISEDLGHSGLKKRFRIEVDNIAFLGNTSAPPATPEPSTVMASSSGGKGGRPSFGSFRKRQRTDEDAPTSSPTPS